MRFWRDSEGRVRWTWRFITFILAFFAALIVSEMTEGVLRNAPPVVSQPVSAVVSILAVYGVVWLWRTKLDRRPIADLGLSRGSAGQFALGFVAGAGSMLLVALAGAAFGWVRFAGWETDSVAWASVFWGLIIGLGPDLAVGFSEELAMRGYLQTNFSEGRPLWRAVLYTGVTFAVLHALSFNSLLPYLLFIVSATVMSVALSTWRLSTGALWVPIGFHAAWNWTQFNVLGFTVNPRPDYSHALVHLDIEGPALWLGAPGMPEGGLLTLLVVTLLAGAAVLATRKRIVWR